MKSWKEVAIYLRRKRCLTGFSTRNFLKEVISRRSDLLTFKEPINDMNEHAFISGDDSIPKVLLAPLSNVVQTLVAFPQLVGTEKPSRSGLRQFANVVIF